MDFKAGLYDSSGSGITGSSDLDIRIKRDADDFFFDFNDTTFKNAGWTTIDGAMTDIDVTNVPGEYEIAVDVSGFDDGVYTVYYVFSGTPAWTSAGEFTLKDGVEITSVMEQIVDGTIDLEEALKIVLAVLAGDIAKSDTQYTFDEQDGTVKLTQVVSDSDVTRTIT